jgi:hypothetical protein
VIEENGRRKHVVPTPLSGIKMMMKYVLSDELDGPVVSALGVRT